MAVRLPYRCQNLHGLVMATIKAWYYIFLPYTLNDDQRLEPNTFSYSAACHEKLDSPEDMEL